GDAWSIEGQALRQVPFDLYGGKGRDVWKPYQQNYETTPGTGPAEQRLKEQDIDGIDAEVLFPGQASGPYFWRSIRDDEVYKACVRAYNDFLAEDYCSVAPDRLLGLGVIPMTNLQDAMVELEHIRTLGLKGGMVCSMASLPYICLLRRPTSAGWRRPMSWPTFATSGTGTGPRRYWGGSRCRRSRRTISKRTFSGVFSRIAWACGCAT